MHINLLESDLEQFTLEECVLGVLVTTHHVMFPHLKNSNSTSAGCNPNNVVIESFM